MLRQQYKLLKTIKNDILFEKIGTIWQRKHIDEERGDLFEVAIGTYDGVEICELTSTFLSEKISEICNKSSIGI